MINTRRCNADRTAGCGTTAPDVKVGKYPSDVATNPKTQTIYVARFGAGSSSGKITVIDARRCNATRATGCSHLKTLALTAGQPHELAVNPVTDTIYAAVATAHGHDMVDVFNGATCNATEPPGADQKPRELKVGKSGGGLGKSSLYLAVNPKTNTLYATNVLRTTENGHTVYVLNGATCDATDHAGCGQKPATITVGEDPSAPAVDPGTDTIYVPNHAGGRLRRHRLGDQRRDLRRRASRRLPSPVSHHLGRLWRDRPRGRPVTPPRLHRQPARTRASR